MAEQVEEQIAKYVVRLKEAEAKLMESVYNLNVGDYVDPRDRNFDPITGTWWNDVGTSDVAKRATHITTEEELKIARDECRMLALWNEFAINGHENRVNYTVGTGHKYEVGTKKGKEVSDEQLEAAQQVIDDFVKENKWQQRQQEIIRRKDRDGECFLQFFAQEEDGMLLVRFVEPGMISTPMGRSGDACCTFGIETDPEDVETVLNYFIIDGGTVPAEKIQHRKINVDCNVKRGLPTFYPVRKALRQAEKIQDNASIVCGIQSAIALIRKHTGATSAGIETMLTNNQDVTVSNQRTGKTEQYKQYAPGSIIDASAQTSYEFPSMGVRPDAFVAVKQDILRAVASRLVIPEFMLTSDASNANYSSTMVAEGPAVKMFERMQATLWEEDMEILDLALDLAVIAGRITQDTRDNVMVDVTFPQLATRDRKEEIEADMLLVNGKCMSKDTCMIKNGLDPDHEKELIEEDTEKNDPFAGMNPAMMPPGAMPPGTPPGVPEIEDEDEDSEEEVKMKEESERQRKVFEKQNAD